MMARGQLGLLVMGAVCGLLLSKAVLGRVHPQFFEQWAAGSDAVEAMQERDHFQNQATDRIDRLKSTGATPAAIQEQKMLLEEQIKTLELEITQARRNHIIVWSARLNALIAAIVIITGIEGATTIAKPSAYTQRLRALSTMRHALLGVWLAMIIALPQVMENASVAFIGLLASIAMAAAFYPGVKRSRGSATNATRP